MSVKATRHFGIIICTRGDGEIFETNGCYAAISLDPDGNRIYVMTDADDATYTYKKEGDHYIGNSENSPMFELLTNGEIIELIMDRLEFEDD